SFTERREPESRPAFPVRAVRTGRRVPRPRPPLVPGTHVMALRPSSVPRRVPLPPPPKSSLPTVPDPASDLARDASPTVTRLLASFDTNPSFESTVASALVAELVDFAAACRLDYATGLVAESEFDCPPFVEGECALGTDVLEDRTTLAALGFAPSTVDPSLFLHTDTSLPPFYVLVYVLQHLGFWYSSPQSTPLPTGHSLSAPPSNESVEPSGPYPELVGYLISSCEAEIYVGAMAAQELRWLTYLLTDLGERPRSSPVLYVDNKAMIALCQEHRLEHRTKHIALRYFLA
ncbi:unnamed protein product, partial [Closterium sp. NIES-53]